MDKLAGIYKIENTKNGKIYIGETEDIPRRWVEHLTNLMLNKHHSYKLQNDFKEYSISDFKFEVIETILLTDANRWLTSTAKLKLVLLCREFAYIKQYEAIKQGYNIQETIVKMLNKEKNCFGSDVANERSYHTLKKFLKEHKELLSVEHELIFDDIILSSKKKSKTKKEKINKSNNKQNESLVSVKEDKVVNEVLNYVLTNDNNENIGGLKVYEVYNKLNETNIIKEKISLQGFKTFLFNNNIIGLANNSYRPTGFSLNNNIIIRGALNTNGKGYQYNDILITPSGEQYITDILLQSASTAS